MDEAFLIGTGNDIVTAFMIAVSLRPDGVWRVHLIGDGVVLIAHEPNERECAASSWTCDLRRIARRRRPRDVCRVGVHPLGCEIAVMSANGVVSA